MFFKKTNEIIIKNAQDITFSFKEGSKVYARDQINERNVIDVNKKNGASVIDLSANERSSHNKHIVVYTNEIESIVFENCQAAICIDEETSCEHFSFNGSHIKIKKIKKHQITLINHESNIVIQSFFVNNAKLHAESNGTISLNEGVILDLKMSCLSKGIIQAKEKRNVIIDVSEAALLYNSKAVLNVAREVNYHCDSSSRFIVKGEPIFVQTRKVVIHKNKVNSKAIEMLSDDYGRQNQTVSFELGYHIKNMVRKLGISQIRKEVKQADKYDAIPFIRSAKKRYKPDVEDRIKTYKSNIESLLSRIDEKSMKDLPIDKYYDHKNHLLNKIYQQLDFITKDNLHFENQEHINFVFTMKKQLIDIRKSLKDIKEESDNLKNIQTQIKKILKMDYPTDIINASNRSFYINLLENCDLKEIDLDEKEEINYFKLLSLFDIESNNKVCRF